MTTNASGGSGTWFDRTGAINPGSFPVSGVAIDTSDATGNTAYVTIMGFHVSHVWKTTNAGVSWTDFTTNLPDAPANAVLVDKGSSPTTGAVYVATDVGVFVSSTASASWTEVGPAPLSGQVGYLPNVSVTALGMFNSAGTKKLRASTYGRGMWEFTLIAAPDFQFVIPNNSLTVFAGQSAIFSGTLQALNGYTSSVNLSCGNLPTPAPPTCSVTPSSLAPTVSGAPFSVNAAGPVADYLFDVHGVGTDANKVTHDFALTLHVVDFNLTAPLPVSVTVSSSNTSAPVSFQVTAAGSFNAAVALSCSGLPAGATCNFQPSSSVNPTSANPAAVGLSISTTTSTPAGTFTITIAANAAGAPSQKTQKLSLVVIAPDFSITNTSGAQTVNAGTTATYGLNISPIGASTFTNAVTYSCAASGLPTLSTCSFIPAQIAGGTAATNVTLSIATTAPPAGTPPGNYTITVIATSGSASHSVQAMLTVAGSTTFDFTISNNSGPQTLQAGQTASYNLEVKPVAGGSTFANNVSLSCSSGLPTLSTCTFTPAQVGSGSGDTNVVLTISATTGAAGTPPGNYTITVTATSGSLTHSTQAALRLAASAGFDFTIINNTSPVTIKTGQQETYNLDVAPTVLGETFPNSVSLACSSGLPAASTCSFVPNQVASGSGNTNVVLTIATTAPIPASARVADSHSSLLFGLWLPLPGLVLVLGGLGRSPRRKRFALFLLLSVLFLLVGLQVACGGGLQGGGGGASGGAGLASTPAGTYTVTVTATSGSISHTVQVALTVTP